MSGKRVCPKCGAIVGEFTYFCTECGAKTEEYHDQPHQSGPSGSVKLTADSPTQEPVQPGSSSGAGLAAPGSAPVSSPENLRTSSAEGTVKPEPSSPPASPKNRSKIKYIVLGAVVLIAVAGLLAGLNKGGKRESRSETAKTTTVAPTRTEKHIEDTEGKKVEKTSAATSLPAYVDNNEPNDSPETAVRAEDGGTYYGYLSSQDDRDYFVIYSERETPVFITFTHKPVSSQYAIGWEISFREEGAEISTMSWLSQETVTAEYTLQVGDNYLFIENSRPKEEFAGISDIVPSVEYAITFNYPKYASDYILPMSDRAYLTEDDLKTLTKDELRLARNELYARHGRLFKDQELQAYFNAFDWYDGRIMPDKFSDSMLNPYEIANRDLIVAYEEKMGYR